jgi:hypothetical protein
MKRAALYRASLVFLYGGVAPVEPVGDPCLKAAFHSAPATEREWLAVTFDVEDLRVHRQGEKAWIEVRDAKWGTDALWAVSRPRWVGGDQIPADSLSIPWSEIERIDKPAGQQAGLGAGVGAFVGLGIGLGIAYALEHDCGGFGCGWGLILPLLTVPAGAVTGAVVGSTKHRWAPFYCAPLPPARGPARPGEAGE